MKNPEKVFKRLVDENASLLSSMTNEMQQRVEFYEHPTYGDMYPVIVSFPDFKLAFVSEFYDLDDMMSESTDEYRPFLINNDLVLGYEK
jgi:hypothetical protein